MNELDGPAVVLIHGFASDRAQDFPATRWAEPLARAGRETVTVDLPGHGNGPAVASAEDGSVARVLEYVDEACRSVAATEIDVVGYSLGARLAWDFAATSTVPVHSMVLGGLSPQEPFAAVDHDALTVQLNAGTPAADPLTGMIASMIGAPGLDSSSLAAMVAGLGRDPFDPEAAPPAVPTLFVRGTDDPITEGIAPVVDLVEGARLVQVPGDHAGALASPEFRTAAFDFLGVHDAS